LPSSELSPGDIDEIQEVLRGFSDNKYLKNEIEYLISVDNSAS